MKPRKILLIEDDSDDRIFFSLALKSIDDSIHLKVATNGCEALEVLKNEDSPPDYIFLDINMPVMDGRECLKEIKKNNLLNNIPVFILSTSTSQSERAEMLKHGARDYICKPSEISALISLVGEAIKSSSKS